MPIAADDERATFRYDGLDGHRSRTHVAFSEPGALQAVAAGRRPRPGRRGPLHVELAARRGRLARARAGSSGRATALSPSGERARRGGRRPGGRRRGHGALPRGRRGSPSDEGAGGVPRLGRAARPPSPPTTSCSTSRSAGASPTCACWSTTVPAEASATSPPACRGSRRCSAGTRSSPRSRRSRSGPQIAVETLDVLAPPPGDRGRRRGATPSRARSSTSCGPARWPGPASCRTRRTTAAIDSTPLWLILLGETYDWTGDRALVDRLWPNALAALDWIDEYGRPRRRRLRRIRAPLAARPAQPGLEGLGRRDPRPARAARRAADRPRRGPGLRLRREAPARAARADARRGRARRCGSTARPTTLQRRFEDALLGRGPALLRDGPRRRQAPGRTRSARTPASASGPGSCRRPARATVADRLLGPALFSRLGDPDLRRRPARLQPDRLPHRARSGRTTRRSSAAGLKRYGFQDEANRIVGHVFEAAQHFRGVPPARSCSAASTAIESPMPVPYPVACSPQAWAAGASVPVPLDDARPAGPRRPAASWSCSGRTCPTGSASARSRTSGSATRRSTCSFHRWRGTTSRGGPAQGRRRLRDDPALSAVLPPADPTDRVATSGELLANAGRAAADGGSETRAGSTPSCCSAFAIGAGPDDDARPSRRAGRARRPAARFEDALGAAARRRAGRLHPRDQGVLRARLRDRRPGADPAARDGAARRGRRSPRCMRRLAHRAGPAALTPSRSGSPTSARAAARSRSRCTVELRTRRVPVAEVVRILATDRSPDALDLARENAVGHAVADYRDASSRPTCCRRAARRRAASTSSARTCRTSATDAIAGLPVAASVRAATGARRRSRRARRHPGAPGPPAGRPRRRRRRARSRSAATRATDAGRRSRRVLPGWRAAVEPDLAGLPRVMRVRR